MKYTHALSSNVDFLAYPKWKATFVNVVTFLLILLFAYTGLSKLVDRERFEAVMWGSKLLYMKAGTISWIVIISELAVTLLLVIPKTHIWGLRISFIMMLLFTLYVGIMIAFVPNKPCSCGGVIQMMSWKQHLIFNILFTVAAFLAIRFDQQKNK